MKPPQQARLRRHVEALCSKPCAGRDAGSVEGRAARRYLLAQLREAGLAPTTQAVPGSRGVNVFAKAGRPGGRVILLAAHYDHIGTAGGDEAYWGADDNAAAVAILLEVARTLDAASLDAELWLVFFDAEEPPHFLTPDMGAEQFVTAPPVALDRVELAVVLDLVGHAVGPADAEAELRNTVFALGGEKSEQGRPILHAAAQRAAGLVVRELDLDVVPPLSDYEPLRRHGVPVLFLTCGRWEHYHEVTDTPDRLDYEKIAATCALAHAIALAAASYHGPTSRYLPDATARRGTLDTLEAVAAALARTHPRDGSVRARLAALAASGAEGDELDDTQWSQLQNALRALEQRLHHA